jgi:hypothetical protein
MGGTGGRGEWRAGERSRRKGKRTGVGEWGREGKEGEKGRKNFGNQNRPLQL